MKALLRIFRNKRFYFSLTFVGLFWFLYGFLELRESDATLLSDLASRVPNVPAEIHYLETQDRDIRYLMVGEKKSSLIVFVHGAPSSMGFWKSMLTDQSLLNQATLMAVDRPGYGYSGFGKAETSVGMQAGYLARMLEPLREQFSSIVLHGSSYGGTVAARLAMDYPDLVDGLLLQSSSVAPGEETIYDITYPTSHWSLEWLIPPTLRVANEEKLSHYKELKAMEEGWDRIRAATLIFHGTADELIFPKNAEYAGLKLENAPFLWKRMFPGKGHDLMWTQRAELKEGLRFLLKVVGDFTTFSARPDSKNRPAISLHE